MKILTTPSGLTGDTKPYPLHLHEWPRAEFEQFLIDHHYPPCTFRDHLDGHRRAVIEALHKGEVVPYAVLADYPDAPAEAAFRRQADQAWADAASRNQKYILRFQASVIRENLLPQFIEGIRTGEHHYVNHHNAHHVNPVVTFEINGQSYWAERYSIPPLGGRFGLMRRASDEWQVRYGPGIHRGAAWEPLLRIPHSQVEIQRPVHVDVIDSRKASA